MRTQIEIISEYNEICKDDTMVEVEPGYHQYANQSKRNALQTEYNQTLPENQQMAIFLHDKLCLCNHTDGCAWYYEFNGIEHKWNANTHMKYLKKADNIIAADIHMDVLQKIFNCIEQ